MLDDLAPDLVADLDVGRVDVAQERSRLAHRHADLHAAAARLGERLRAARHRLVTAESCTGGWIAKAVTDVPGSSDWFDCGMAAYSYEAKQAMLGVNPLTLEVHGAVSRECVVEMVSGALVHSGATLAVAVTGIAGPGGGTPDKPVGTVWIAWAVRNDTIRCLQTSRFRFDGDRDEVRAAVVERALAGVLELARPDPHAAEDRSGDA